MIRLNLFMIWFFALSFLIISYLQVLSSKFIKSNHCCFSIYSFHAFLYDWKAVLFIFCIRISFSGRSLLTGLFVASPRYPPGFSLLSLTLYAPAMPEERYDDFFLN